MNNSTRLKPEIKRCNSTHPDFQSLVHLLDAELAVFDGEAHAFYHQYNRIDDLQYTLVAYLENLPVACGAIKPLETGVMEVKRMYVSETFRGRGIATEILKELEYWAAELGANRCILETGKKQESALVLYPKNGYRIIPNYGQYEGVENSVCFEKWIE